MQEILNKLRDLNIESISEEGEVFFSEEFEDAIVAYKELQETFKEAEKIIKDKITNVANKNPEVTKIEGKKIITSFSRPINKVLSIEPKEKLDDPAVIEFIKAYCVIKPDSKAINDHIKATTVKLEGKKHYELPAFIEEVEGTPRTTFRIIK